MALLNILFGRKTKASIGGITIDAVIEDDHERDCEVTENPVEDGANVTDHVHLKPVHLTINGVISDTPIDFGILNNLATGNISGLSNSVKSLGGSKRSIEQYNKLVELQKKREPFEVVTGLRVYKNMILKRLQVQRNAQKGQAIHFTAELMEIKIIGSGVLGSFNLSDDVQDLASPNRNQGRKIASEITQGLNPTLFQSVSAGFGVVGRFI